MRDLVVILHNIRSIHNVGSIFRTADGAGVKKLFLTGITPGPLDAFDRPRDQFVKVSLGAEESVPWEKKRSIGALIKTLRGEGWSIMALEQHARSVSYSSLRREKRIALIVGSEPKGLPPSILRQCDAILEIPMRGKKESLNVSVACGVALYQLLQ